MNHMASSAGCVAGHRDWILWQPACDWCENREKKASGNDYWLYVEFIGRDGVIRTHDPLHPMQVRYQTALRPEVGVLYQHFVMLFHFCMRGKAEMTGRL